MRASGSSVPRAAGPTARHRWLPARRCDADTRRPKSARRAGGSHRERSRVALPVVGGADELIVAIRALDAAGVALEDIALRRPTLDDVFLTLTGHTTETPTPEEAA
jgi:ABC-2 type transport system ATP-binding protein